MWPAGQGQLVRTKHAGLLGDDLLTILLQIEFEMAEKKQRSSSPGALGNSFQDAALWWERSLNRDHGRETGPGPCTRGAGTEWFLAGGEGELPSHPNGAGRGGSPQGRSAKRGLHESVLTRFPTPRRNLGEGSKEQVPLELGVLGLAGG